MNPFSSLGIMEPIVKAIEQEKFEKPSDIQAQAIPLILNGDDVIAGAATGSGKTLAFGSGIIQHTEKGQGIQALILTPTRELCIQVARELTKFSKFKGLKVVPIYGGVSIMPQIHSLETADIVVGTPGRILDHRERGTMRLDHLKTLVLDEADRMLDMGFIQDVERIISSCPKERQTLFFSATISNDIAHLAERYMNDPYEVSVECYVDPKKLKQMYYDVPDNMKLSVLVHLLKKDRNGLAMVFCNTQRNTDFVEKNLRSCGVKALAIHGGLSQAKRKRVMDTFYSQDVPVLVCTDVAARGLDIKGVSQVYNYDTPKESNQYIHRVGRTARAGAEGMAVNILSSHDHENFRRVLRDYDLDIERLDVPEVERVRVQRLDRGFGHGRGSPFGRRHGNGFARRGNGYNRGNGRPRGFGGQGRSHGSGQRSQGHRSGGQRSFGNRPSGQGRPSFGHARRR